MTTKHTPGPWELQTLELNHHGYDWPTYTIRSAKNHCLAVVGDVDRATSKENAANAALIVAAPKLLAALKRYVSWQEGKFDAIDIELEILNPARAAISEAEGRA